MIADMVTRFYRDSNRFQVRFHFPQSPAQNVPCIIANPVPHLAYQGKIGRW